LPRKFVYHMRNRFQRALQTGPNIFWAVSMAKQPRWNRTPGGSGQ